MDVKVIRSKFTDNLKTFCSLCVTEYVCVCVMMNNETKTNMWCSSLDTNRAKRNVLDRKIVAEVEEEEEAATAGT